MITASLKQHVHRRRSRIPVTRFRLFVHGRMRGVWEKQAERAKLVARMPAPSKATPRPGWIHFLSARRWLLFPALGLIGLALLLVVFLCFHSEPLEPLLLPPDGAALSNPLVDSLSDSADDEAPPVAGLTLKKLTLNTYSVRSRDTLETIAKRFNLDIDTIISFNGIRDARTVGKGSVLTLPSRRGLRYRVRSGDSLSGISQRFNVSLDDLLDWNNLARSVIKAGQGLFIPGGRLSKSELSRVMGTTFAWPVRGRFTSPFGMRISPIDGVRRHHNGIDIANDFRTPIHAAAAGRVAIVDFNPTYGNYIILVHGNGFQTLYGHLQSALVKKGTRVSLGQKIATMGSTGSSTGTHLHFSVFKNGKDVDPLKYLK